ncbi:MAG: PAS domain-containing protein [Verrucomicrobiota bacterium]
MTTRDLQFTEYKTLVEQAPILIWRADLTMGCDYFNARWLVFTGRTMEEEMGNGWASGVHPDDLDHCLNRYTRAFARQEVFEMEYRLRRSDGEYRWLFDRGVPFNDAEGHFAGYIGSCIDVTESVDARANLKAAQDAEVKSLQELLPVCAWCSKVRKDSGYWSQLEQYVSEHSGLRFTHGICPDCQRKHFPDVDDHKD